MKVRVGGLLGLAVLLGACAQEGWPRCAGAVFDTEGHRGARAYRPEDSLPAMEYGLSKGVNTLEMDLAVTADGALVLSHDPRLLHERCLAPGGEPAADVPIHSLTLAEVRRFDCGSLPTKGFPDQVAVPGTPPPTLMEVLQLGERRSGGKVHYNIEIKTDPAWDPAWTPPVEEFVRLLEQDVAAAGVGSRVIVQSFDVRALRVLAERHSALKRSWLIPATTFRLATAPVEDALVKQAQELRVDILSPYAALTPRPLVDLAHARGIAVVPWTVNTRAEMERLVGDGVDGLISDDVDLLVQVARDAKPRGGLCF